MNWTVAVLLAGCLAGSALAQTTAPAAQPNILDRAVNAPGIAWTQYGADQTVRQVKAEGIPGGAAVHVTVARKGQNPYDIGAIYPTTKPIAAGDVVLVAVYLRAPATKPGETMSIPLGAGEGGAPYTPIGVEPVQINAAWKLYYVSGIAPKGFARGKAQITVQLAGEKQVLELGPAFLLNYGQGYDRNRLPRN